MKTSILVLFASLVVLGPASAGAEIHAFVQADSETHAVDIFVSDDGTVVLLVDGAPVPEAPEMPEAPETPEAPEAPAVPELPEVPDAPEFPALP